MAERTEANGVALSEDAKRRITLEETYRSEVKSALERQSERPTNRFIRFLNSALGLWLLSTIFVSIIGTAYARAQQAWDSDRIVEGERRQQERRRAESIAKLDLEIAFRLSSLIAYFHGAYRQQTGADGAALAGRITPLGLTTLIQIPPGRSPDFQLTTVSLYGEYRDATVVGLLAELSRLEKERGNSTEDIDQVIARLTAIPMLFERKNLDRPSANALAIASAFQEEVFLPRWRNNAFAFTDCSVRTPFC